MKQIKKISKLFFVIVILFFFFSSCEKNKSDLQDSSKGQIEEPYLRITSGTADKTIDYDGGSYSIWIESNTNWVCGINAGCNINLRVDKTKGFGNDVVVVSYDNSRNANIRSTTISTFIIKWTNKLGFSETKTINFIRYKDPYL